MFWRIEISKQRQSRGRHLPLKFQWKSPTRCLWNCARVEHVNMRLMRSHTVNAARLVGFHTPHTDTMVHWTHWRSQHKDPERQRKTVSEWTYRWRWLNKCGKKTPGPRTWLGHEVQGPGSRTWGYDRSRTEPTEGLSYRWLEMLVLVLVQVLKD